MKEQGVLIEYVDSRIEKEAVTKLDLKETENELRSEINKLELKIKDLDWKMKFYFIVIVILIIINNPKVIDLFGKLLGLIK